MADNRMYIRCKGCGAVLFLAKRSIGNGWFGVESGAEKGEELTEFISDHEHCCDHLSAEACDGVNPWAHEFEPFELDYEMRDDFMERLCYQERQRQIDLGRSTGTKVLQRINVQKPMKDLTGECWDSPKQLPVDIREIAVNYSSSFGTFDERTIGRVIKHDWGLMTEVVTMVQKDKVKPTPAGHCQDLTAIYKAMEGVTLQWIDILSDGAACVWVKDSLE